MKKFFISFISFFLSDLTSRHVDRISSRAEDRGNIHILRSEFVGKLLLRWHLTNCSKKKKKEYFHNGNRNSFATRVRKQEKKFYSLTYIPTRLVSSQLAPISLVSESFHVLILVLPHNHGGIRISRKKSRGERRKISRKSKPISTLERTVEGTAARLSTYCKTARRPRGGIEK